MNPRYLNYCRAHGRGPKEQLAHDRKEFPGSAWDHWLERAAGLIGA